jgi:hypothetical protein
MSPLPTADDDPPPVAPEPPQEGECCGSGCDPCVYDLYYEAREHHRVAMREWQQRRAAAGPAASIEPIATARDSEK